MKKKRKPQLNSSWMDSTYLLEFEDYLLGKYSLLKTLPLFKKWRLGKAIDKWNKEQD